MSHSNLKPLITVDKRPVGNYYAELTWDQGFEQWNLVRFNTPADGNCLFHAIANSSFTNYWEEKAKDKFMSRKDIVVNLRKELAHKLAEPLNNDLEAPTHYQILNGGNMTEFAKAVEEYKLSEMQAQLNSNNSIGYGYLEFLGNAFNLDIYILEGARRDIYMNNESQYSIKGDRDSIVLYYISEHYELVGIQTAKNKFDTCFAPNHSLIEFLFDKVQNYLNGRKD